METRQKTGGATPTLMAAFKANGEGQEAELGACRPRLN